MLHHLVPLVWLRNSWKEVEKIVSHFEFWQQMSYFWAHIPVFLQSFVPKMWHLLQNNYFLPLRFKRFWAEPVGYQNGLSDITCHNIQRKMDKIQHELQKSSIQINLCLFDRVQSTTFPLDHTCHIWLWMGSTNEIAPYTHSKAHGQLRHVWWPKVCTVIWPKK